MSNEELVLAMPIDITAGGLQFCSSDGLGSISWRANSTRCTLPDSGAISFLCVREDGTTFEGTALLSSSESCDWEIQCSCRELLLLGRDERNLITQGSLVSSDGDTAVWLAVADRFSFHSSKPKLAETHVAIVPHPKVSSVRRGEGR